MRNLLLRSTATFMPNTFDQFGQPLVMMPYPQQPPPSSAAEPVPLEADDQLTAEVEESEAATADTASVVGNAEVVNECATAVVLGNGIDLLHQEATQEVPEPNQTEVRIDF